MPERWQDELKKLRREEMPEGVRDRAERGPQRELPRDGRQRLVAGVVAFAVFFAAGAFAWRAFDDNGSPATRPSPTGPSPIAVLTLLGSGPGHPNYPSADLSFGADAVGGQVSRYEWHGRLPATVVRYTSFFTLSEHPLVLPPTTPVSVHGDAGSIEVALRAVHGSTWEDPVPAEVVADRFSVPETPGRYLMVVTATWPKGMLEFAFSIEVLPPADQTPDVLHLSCTPDSASLDSGIVRAQADGVHIAVDASDDVSGAEIVTGSMPEDFVGVGLDARDDGSRGIPIQPGRWSVGCYAARGGVDMSDIGTAKVPSFTVIDPGGFYVDDTLACDVTTSTTIDATGSVDPTHQGWDSMISDSAAAIPGLLPTDTVRDTGYLEGAGSKDGLHPVVVRDGSVIATIRFGELAAAGGSWNFTLESCQGSGLGDEGAATQGSSAPDVAVVRCTADGTELETPVVKVQPDGLHIGAMNEADAGIVDVEPADVSDETAGTLAFDGRGKGETVLHVTPGQALIACLPPNENGVTTLGSDIHPDLYVSVKIMDPSGYFLPYSLTCDASEEVSISTSDPGVLPSSDTIVRARVPGILDDDIVERAGYLEGPSDEGLWRVVRGGEVVAQIRYPVEQGAACRGSGIGGA